MNPEQSKLDPNQVSVGLAQTNNFLQGHLQSMMPPPSPGGPTSPGSEPGASQPAPQQDVQAEIQGLETRLMDELKTLREDMKTQGDGKAELADLKKQIEQILASTD